MRNYWLILFALAASAFMSVSIGHAQDTLAPLWTKGSYNAPLQYSQNGSVVTSSENGYTIKAWSTATKKLIAIIGFTYTDSHVPAPDGSGVYYSTGSPAKVYFYNFATRSTTLIRSEVAPYQSGSYLAVATDASHLAFKSYNTTTGRYVIRMFSASTGTLTGSYTLAASTDTQQIAFVNGDTKVLIGGIRLIALTGGQTGSRVVPATDYFALSPDRTKAYGKDASGNLLAYDLTQTSGLPTLWTSNASTIDARAQCSADGTMLVSNGLNDSNTHYAFRFFRTSDGVRLAGSLDYSPTYNAGYYAADHQATNSLIYYTYEGGGQVMHWLLDTTNGGGTQQSPLDSGNGGATIQSFGSTNPRFAVEDTIFGGLRARNAATGAQTFYTPKYGAKFSPDGQYFAWVGNRESDNAYGAHIYRMSDGVRVASYNSSDTAYCGWNENDRFWVVRNTVNKARIFTFTGTGLSLINELNGPNVNTVALSKDATRFAWLNGTIIHVFDVVAGTEIGTFDATGHTNVINMGFAGNRLWLHRWLYDGVVTYTNQIQVRDVTTNAFTVVKEVSYNTNDALYGDYGFARLSNDMSVAVFARCFAPLSDARVRSELKIIRVSDGQVLKSYNDQFSDSYVKDLAIATNNVSFSVLGYFALTMYGAELQPVVNSIALNPIAVVGGNSSTATVTINRPAPAGGVTLAITGEGTDVPATVTVLEGNTTVDFTVGTVGVDTAITKWITATYGGLAVTAPLQINPPSAITIGFNPATVDGGQSSTGTVTLNGQAGPSGFVVTLSSDKAYATVPASVTVASGATSNTFTANTTDPGSSGTATITGVNGAVSGSGALLVNATGVQARFLESAIKGGNALTLRITLVAPAPAGGLVFNLAGDALSTPQASVKITQGKSSIDLGVNTNATLTNGTTTVTVTPAAGGAARTATATVQAPVIRAIYIAQTPIAGPKIVKLLVLLDGIAPTGLSFAVSSSVPATVVVPSTVTIPAGSLFGTLDLDVKKSSGQKSVVINVGGKTMSILVKASPN